MITLTWHPASDTYDILDNGRVVLAGARDEQTGDWFATQITSGNLTPDTHVPSFTDSEESNYRYTAADIAEDFPRESEKTTCRSCDAYVHRYLPRCPVCGYERPSDLPRAVDLWKKAQTGDPDAVRRLEKSCLNVAMPFGDNKNKYRYHGDLPGHPACDALISERNGEFSLVVSNGAPITKVPGESVVSVHYFPDSVAYTGWSGIYVGGVMAFSQGAMAHSAALSVAYSAGGRILQFSLGNRPGLFSPKYVVVSYMSVAMGIGEIADVMGRRREAKVGPLAYARELGLDALAGQVEADGREEAISDRATEPPPPHPDPENLLKNLKAMRENDLITDTEYAAKRAEVIARL